MVGMKFNRGDKMKLTKTVLKQIIREEIQKLNEDTKVSNSEILDTVQNFQDLIYKLKKDKTKDKKIVNTLWTHASKLTTALHNLVKIAGR